MIKEGTGRVEVITGNHPDSSVGLSFFLSFCSAGSGAQALGYSGPALYHQASCSAQLFFSWFQFSSTQMLSCRVTVDWLPVHLLFPLFV